MRNSTVRTIFPSIFTLLFLIVLILLSTGCGSSGSGGGSGGNVVTGVVRDALDGDRALQNVVVTIGGVSGKTRTADTASADNPVGSFALQNVPAGAHSAVVALAGSSTQTFIFVPPIASGTNRRINLYANSGQISGRILRANGEPAASATVTIGATSEKIQTNADGTFLAARVPQGDTTVYVVESTAFAQKTVTVNFGNTAIGDITVKGPFSF